MVHSRNSYLDWLAARRGIDVPRGASYGDDGITADGVLILPMPGYGVPETVTMEALDDAGNVIRSNVIGCKPNGSLGLTKEAVRAIAGKIDKPRKPRAVKSTPTEAVERVAAIEAPVAPPIAPVALPAPSGDVLERLARIESALGFTSRPARTERHAAAIRRAWAMRKAMRERADLDRRALLAANAAYAAVKAARVAAVHRSECDASRLVAMEAERDEALAMAEAEEARANAIVRGNSISDARADRLARIATDQRRRLSYAQQDIARAMTDARTARASERRAVAKLSEIRHAVDASAIVSKIVEKALAA